MVGYDPIEVITKEGIVHAQSILAPHRTVHAHCDLPCGVYDPAQARIEAESVKACQEKYQGSDDEVFKDARGRDQGRARRPGEAPPVGAVDRLLQARAPRDAPGAARDVLEGHQGGRRAKKSKDPAQGQKLLDAIDEIGKVFWETKS